ncbi:hypothetical protein [Herbaspirillum frisingense]|uniref:Lipid-binding transport protein (Tim44 family) n=1 Tax=Herbaspirillum frisingense TaxID=92645 RepID=A0ABU1PDK3_9BURK|nr:hypothetical protein [Herbaspirillum frisingense]MDR6583810.1 putative lipid-binding transport protein (Tim44 family) [Herbaspirillum frisingense]
MEKPAQSKKEVPGRMTGLIGLSMFGIGLIGLIPALIGLFILGGIVWYGVPFMIKLFGILFS